MSTSTDAVAQALAKTVARRIEQSRTTTQRGIVTAVGTDGIVTFDVADSGSRIGMHIGEPPVVGDIIVYIDEGRGIPLVIGATGKGWWTTYTPTWTSSGSPPAIGNGSVTGRYKRSGATLHLQQHIVIGSTSTLGSGAIRLSLPSGMSGGSITSTGSGYWMDVSTGILTPAVTIVDAASTYVYGWLGTGTTPGDSSGLGTGDFLHYGGTFEIAP